MVLNPSDIKKVSVSVKEALYILHCGRPTLYRWIKQGTIEASKDGGTRNIWLPAEMLPKSAK